MTIPEIAYRKRKDRDPFGTLPPGAWPKSCRRLARQAQMQLQQEKAKWLGFSSVCEMLLVGLSAWRDLYKKVRVPWFAVVARQFSSASFRVFWFQGFRFAVCQAGRDPHIYRILETEDLMKIWLPLLEVICRWKQQDENFQGAGWCSRKHFDVSCYTANLSAHLRNLKKCCVGLLETFAPPRLSGQDLELVNGTLLFTAIRRCNNHYSKSGRNPSRKEKTSSRINRVSMMPRFHGHFILRGARGASTSHTTHGRPGANFRDGRIFWKKVKSTHHPCWALL